LLNILLTNDDGVHAEGILALKQVLSEFADVFILAPDRPRSACGHSITLHKPLRVSTVKLHDGTLAIASNGTPSDCVSLALLGVVEAKIDLVISGINHGPNLGWDLTYSGTVSAAMEAVIGGIKSIAVSVTSYDVDIDYTAAANFTASLAKLMSMKELPESTLLNVNVPNIPESEIKGVEVTRQGKRRYSSFIEKRTDPVGRTYYWLSGDEPIEIPDEGTDVKAIIDGKISVTPVHLDLTDDISWSSVKGWGIER
jgi:5'-nucleotidase